MSRVVKHLNRWENAGLINSHQVENILAFEKKSGSSYALYGLIMLGITILSIGIISLVAVNWQNISGYAKIGADFIIISSIALLIYYAHLNNKSVLFDALISLFMFLYLVSIGLISQVFHTGGPLYQALFLWIVATMPIILFTHGKFAQRVWVTSLLTTIIMYCPEIAIIEDKGRLESLQFGILLSLPLFCGIMGTLLSQFNLTKKLSGIFIFYSIFMIFFSIFGFDLWHSFDIEYARDLKNILYLSSPFYITITVFSITFIALCFLKKNLDIKIRVFSLLLSFFYSGMLFLLIPFSSMTGNYSLIHSNGLTTVMKLAPAISIAGMFILAFLFSSMSYNKLFSLCLNLIGIRFLFIYFQVFGSLAYTGFGLIFSGLMIIFLVILWKKYSKKLFDKLSRFIKSEQE
jgi:uncharacterized membrane protein